MIELGWVDELGSSITNITKYLPHYSKGAKPSFIEDSMFTTIIPLTHKVHDKMHDKLRDKLRVKIILIIKENPIITIAEIAELTDKNERGISNNIKMLQDDGILTREVSRKKGKWIIMKDISNK